MRSRAVTPETLLERSSSRHIYVSLIQLNRSRSKPNQAKLKPNWTEFLFMFYSCDDIQCWIFQQTQALYYYTYTFYLSVNHVSEYYVFPFVFHESCPPLSPNDFKTVWWRECVYVCVWERCLSKTETTFIYVNFSFLKRSDG